MSGLTRRDFIKSSVAVGAGLALATPFSKAVGANDDIRVAVIGTGGRGVAHCGELSQLPGVRLVAISDPDLQRLGREAERLKERGIEVKTYQDFRRLLEDKEIDAVSSATPNHWHALVTILACQAGKDVYIEKPASYSIWEGRKMVEAARKYRRIVQHGTQRRSSEAYQAAHEYIKQGNLGALKWARGLCYKQRNVGEGLIVPTKEPLVLPPTTDYNLWCGPADMQPLYRDNLHYVWHWIWNTGNGDIGNQGIHEIDEARWALGDPKPASHVISIGGRFGVGDAAETPNTQIVFFDYKPAPLIFEVHGLPRVKDQRGMAGYRGITIGVVIQCENGYFAAGEGGGWAYDNDGNRLQQFVGSGGHMQNFIDVVRSRKAKDLNADIEVGHISSILFHMANTSHRLGKRASIDEVRAAIGDNADFMDSFDRMLENLKANEVDLEKEPITLGPMLTLNPEKEQWIGEYGDLANMFLKRNYREPFVIPEHV